MSPTYLKQAEVVDVKPLPPRPSTDTNDADTERADRHKARKGVAVKIYRLLEHQPESWPHQWRLRFSELTRPQRVSFVSKLEQELYKGSLTIEEHLDTATMPGRVYDFLDQLDGQNKEQTGATGSITVDCAFDDNGAISSHDNISPQSVMEDVSQHQQKPHRQHARCTTWTSHPSAYPNATTICPTKSCRRRRKMVELMLRATCRLSAKMRRQGPT